jgi:DTW domain-containing protein YfiP
MYSRLQSVTQRASPRTIQSEKCRVGAEKKRRHLSTAVSDSRFSSSIQNSSEKCGLLMGCVASLVNKADQKQELQQSSSSIMQMRLGGLKKIFYATSIIIRPVVAAFSIKSMTTFTQDKHNASFTGETASSLAHLVSSTERFAASLNMTVEQVDEAINARRLASATLNEQLIAFEEDNKEIMTAAEIGRRKHRMICQHRFQNFRNAFVCKKCWTFTPICVCHLFEHRESNDDAEGDNKAPLPQGVEKLIVWTHHDEYGRTSNTGSLLPLGLRQTHILMKGLLEHEELFNEILCQKDLTFVVLFPDKKSNRASTTITDLKRIITETSSRSQNDDNNKGGIVLISIEGTWNTARKMVNKLPPHVLRLDLSHEIRLNFTTPEINDGVFIDTNVTMPNELSPSSSSPSLLAPLRRQGKGAKQDCVSTVEATIVALLALGLSVEEASFILNCARTKVKRIQEYTGKTYPRD